MAKQTRPSVIVQARLSRAISIPAHGSTFLTNVVEMTLSTAHPSAAPAMRDHGIFGESHDDSHAGVESFQWAYRIDAPATHTKAVTNVAPSESGTSRIPTLRNAHSISPSLVKNRNRPRWMGNRDRNRPAMTPKNSI